MFQAKHVKQITKQKDWGKKKRKYRNQGNTYNTILKNYEKEMKSE